MAAIVHSIAQFAGLPFDPALIGGMFGVVGIWTGIVMRKRPFKSECRRRHRRAVRVAVITNIAALVLSIVLAILVSQHQSDPMVAADVRITSAIIGSIVLSCWLGLAAYGITRLLLRIRRGPSPSPPLRPLPDSAPPPDFSGLG